MQIVIDHTGCYGRIEVAHTGYFHSKNFDRLLGIFSLARRSDAMADSFAVREDSNHPASACDSLENERLLRVLSGRWKGGVIGSIDAYLPMWCSANWHSAGEVSIKVPVTKKRKYKILFLGG